MRYQNIYCRSGNIREILIFANFARGDKFTNSRISQKNIIIIVLPKKNENSQILNSVKSTKIRNSRKFKHTNMTRSTVYNLCTTPPHLQYSNLSRDLQSLIILKECSPLCTNSGTHLYPESTTLIADSLSANSIFI